MAFRSDVTLNVEGAKELRRLAKKVAGAEANKAMKEGHRKVSTLIADHAKVATTPVDSGALAASIKAAPTASKAMVQAGAGKSRDYAGVQHFGDPARNIPASMYLSESVSEEWRTVKEAYEKFIHELALQLATRGAL